MFTSRKFKLYKNSEFLVCMTVSICIKAPQRNLMDKNMTIQIKNKIKNKHYIIKSITKLLSFDVHLQTIEADFKCITC